MMMPPAEKKPATRDSVDFSRVSKERFSAAMEQAPFSIQVLAPDGRTIHVNRAWQKLWGLTLEQIADYNVLSDPQLDRSGVTPYLRRAFAGEVVRIPAIWYDPDSTIPGRTRNDDPQRWISALAYPVKDASGQLIEVVLVHDDITPERKAALALGQSEERWRILAETLPNLVWTDLPDGRCDWLSTQWGKYTGIPEQQLLGLVWLDRVIHPDDRERTLAAWNAACADEAPYDVEYRIRRYDGTYRWFKTRGVPVRDDRGKIVYWFGTCTDIEDVKRLEAALRDADRRKDEFLATLAHELRNPLAPLLNSLQLLKMPRLDGATIERTRQTMERQVHHLVRLIDDLLDVSRVMRGKISLQRERLELSTIVARGVETARPIIDAQGHDLQIDLPDAPLPLEADPVRMAQVFANLFNNAAKYTPAGGRISLSAKREGADIEVRVRDTGIGIAPELLSGIFDLFVQADPSASRSQGGLGIGLTLVKSLVEMHGGTICARSGGLGRGSEFVVRLPLARAQSADGSRDSASMQLPPARIIRRVLVIDDNQDAAETLALLLQLEGHEVHVAHDGPAGLEAAVSLRPDVIFLDLGMPGMDGYEVARRLRQEPGLKETRLAALTGWGQQEDRRRSAEAGFDAHLVKPVDPTAIHLFLSDVDGASESE